LQGHIIELYPKPGKFILHPHIPVLHNPPNIICLLTPRYSEKSLLSDYLTKISEAFLISNMCQVLRFHILIFEGLPGVNFEKYN